MGRPLLTGFAGSQSDGGGGKPVFAVFAEKGVFLGSFWGGSTWLLLYDPYFLKTALELKPMSARQSFFTSKT